MASQIDAADAEGLVAFDSWAEMPLNCHEARLNSAVERLDSLPEGLTMFICHPAADTEELRAIAPDWQARVADHALCCDPRWLRAIEASGVRLVSMHEVRSAMFGEAG